MNTEATTEYIRSTSHSTTSRKLAKYYAEKLYNEVDPIMRKVYFNTLMRLLNGKLETS